MIMATANRSQSAWLRLAVLCAVLPATAAELTAKGSPDAMLYLTDGDFFAGTLEDSETPNVVCWKCAGAVLPFQFPTSAIRSVYFPAPPRPAAAEAEYCFELTDGDLLFGTLASLDAQTAEIESGRLGRMKIERLQIRRFFPWRGADAWEYSGPNGLSEWQQEPQKNGWQEEAGHLFTDVPGASLLQKIQIPRKARVEFALSWTDSPNFNFGITASGNWPEKDGFHFEVWSKHLVAVGEFGTEADVASICDLTTVRNRVHLQALIDQQVGRMSIHSLDGKKLAEMQVKQKDRALWGISLRNQRGDVRFEQLVVSRWDGQPPPQIDVQRQRIHQQDGSVVYGDILRFEAAARQFIVRTATEETRVGANKVSSAVLTPGAQAPAADIRIGCHDGSRLSGQIAKVQNGKLHVARGGFAEPVAIPAADVRFLVSAAGGLHGPQDNPKPPRLELKGMRSHGALVDAKSDEKTSCLVWQPRQSITSSPLEQNVSGRIVYRDPPPPTSAPRQPRRRPGLMDRFMEAFSSPPQVAEPARLSGYPHALFLVAGDRIPCTVFRIDDDGVHFTSPVVQSETVPHVQIKALELVPRTAGAILEEEKRLRLLTLPRMQKNNPPTHLVASTSGDYLRARVDRMDPQTLYAETRLETKRLPRGRVASIIWLHPARTEKRRPVTGETPTLPSVRVQTVRADGVRLTFIPHEFANNSLVGTSELLGACQVDLKTVDRVLLGDMIEASTDETLYGAWRLHDAIQPKFAQDDTKASGESPAGRNSTLVSKPAPDFRLDLLDGGNYRLHDARGRIVVLDFWTTWCAPCMQGMPEVYNVVREFEDQDVEFVAVNMQEDRTTIAAALDRLNVQPAVALDIDGATAEKYEVSAIPQTVIIDKEGNIARIFIGADPNADDQLRDAIRRLLATPDNKETGS
jgi:thiol-disulfide isomerase/thioredoxin